MNTRATVLMLAGLSLSCAAAASGEEIRIRFVERVGTTDTVLDGNMLDGTSRDNRRIRVQMGIFDNAEGRAAAGGIVGWGEGVIENEDWSGRRTPGRLGVFTSPPDGNGVPATDPFEGLTGIEALRGPQSLVWMCDGGEPTPVPTPVVLGRNTYVSVWEMTLEVSGCRVHTLTVSGVVAAASEWVEASPPVPPQCNEPSMPGQVVYEAAGLREFPFSANLIAIIGGGGCWVDIVRDGVVNSQDFFEFLTLFFNGSMDFNCDDKTDSQDFFDYLASFFAGC